MNQNPFTLICAQENINFNKKNSNFVYEFCVMRSVEARVKIINVKLSWINIKIIIWIIVGIFYIRIRSSFYTHLQNEKMEPFVKEVK